MWRGDAALLRVDNAVSAELSVLMPALQCHPAKPCRLTERLAATHLASRQMSGSLLTTVHALIYPMGRHGEAETL